MTEKDGPVVVSVGEGSYFRVGDVIRNARTGEPLEVTVRSSASYVFVVRLRWYRRAWLRVRSAARWVVGR